MKKTYEELEKEFIERDIQGRFGRHRPSSPICFIPYSTCRLDDYSNQLIKEMVKILRERDEQGLLS